MGNPNRLAVVIPFRDRGVDPLRKANLERVLDHWRVYTKTPTVVGDGRDGAAQFNRSAAYNAGVRECRSADVFVFTESDMLIDYHQIDQAVGQAVSTPGLVVPFTQYCYHGATVSDRIREGLDANRFTPESTMDNGRSIGAINIVSRATLDLIGQWDENFEGNWYDDDAMKIAFELCAGPTRWITGPAHHLYHLPGWKGDHLTDADRAATAANKARLRQYQRAETAAQIRELTRSAR